MTTMNYSILTGDVRVAAAQLAEEIEAIVAETGYERIHVVGHSMGGLIARYYVTRLGGDERVHTLVTLGSPHHGTYLAYAWNSRIMQQLRPGSPLMQELEQPVESCRTRFLCYWSDIDQLMFPPALGRPGAPRSQRDERRDAWRRSHEPAHHAVRGARDRGRAGPPGLRRQHGGAGRDAVRRRRRSG